MRFPFSESFLKLILFSRVIVLISFFPKGTSERTFLFYKTFVCLSYGAE